jgi:two-component system nitrogen regulation response regulator GlnG
VRQLENVAHWLTVMAPAQTVDVADLPPELREAAVSGTEAHWTAALRREVEKALARGDAQIMEALTREFERALIARALEHTGGRRIEAATLLGIGRNTITRKIAELGIEDRNGRAVDSSPE